MALMLMLATLLALGLAWSAGLMPATLLLLALALPATAQPAPDRAALAAKTKAEFLHAWESYKKFARLRRTPAPQQGGKELATGVTPFS